MAGSEGHGSGAELASGFISLSVKYNNAMSQIGRDFGEFESRAAASGTKAGSALGSNLANGFTAHGGVVKAMDGIGATLVDNSTSIGSRIGHALSSTVGAGFSGVTRGVNKTFDEVESVATRSVQSIGSHIVGLLTGPMAQLLGATTVIGGAFGLLEKGWIRDTDIQKTNVQLQSFGGTAQDVAGFWQDVNKAVAGTQYSITQVSDTARSLFQEGLRGDKLSSTLKEIENITDASGQSIESITQLYEKATGRDTLNSMMMGQLEGPFKAREVLEKGLNVSSEKLDEMVKGNKITFDDLFKFLGDQTAGTSEKMAHTWEGQFNIMKNNLSKIGGDLLQSFVGGGGGFESVNAALDKLDGWINSHQAEINNVFKEMMDDAKTLGQLIGDVVGWMSQHRNLVRDVGIFLLTWKIGSEFITGIQTVAKVFGAIADSTIFEKIAGLWPNMNLVADGMGKVAVEGDAAAGGIEATGAAAATSAGGVSSLATALGAVASVIGPLAELIGSTGIANKLGNLMQGTNWGWWDVVKHALGTPKRLYGMATGTIDPNTGQPIGGDSSPSPSNAPQLFPLDRSGIGSSGDAGQTSTGSNDLFGTSHLDGGISSYAWGGVHHHGRLPRHAKIQSPIGPAGLVNWAEPGTGGEAFIPLHPAKRHRSLEVWKQTGNILLGGMKFGAHGGGKLWKFDSGGFMTSGADPRPSDSGVLQVIWSNAVTGQKVGEAGGQLVGPGTSQGGYYRSDWGGHTGHVHTAFATGPGGEFYGLRKGTDIRQGSSGFPRWVYQLGAQFGLEPSTYAGHQEASGYNRGIDWWPKGHSDMSGSSYTPQDRQRLQNFAQAIAGAAASGKWGSFSGGGGGGGDQYTSGGVRYTSGSMGGSGRGARFGRHGGIGGDGSGGGSGDYNLGDLGNGDSGGAGVGGYDNGGNSIGGLGDSSGSYRGLSSFLSQQQYVGGAKPFKDDSPSVAEQAAEEKRERNLQEKIDTIQGEIDNLNEKKKEWDDKTKQSTKDELERKLSEKEQKKSDAAKDLETAKTNWQNRLDATVQRDDYKQQYESLYPMMGQNGSSAGDSGMGDSNLFNANNNGLSEKSPFKMPDLQGLGDIMTNGLAQEFLPPGFMNPFGSDMFRIPSVLLGFIGKIIGGPTGQALNLAGAVMSGKGSNVAAAIQSFIPQPFGTLNPASPGKESSQARLAGQLPAVGSMSQSAMGGNFGAPTGPAPGPLDAQGNPTTVQIGPTYNNSPIGMSPDAFRQSQQNDANATSRKTTFNTQRLATTP